jgi:hypothetical protein
MQLNKGQQNKIIIKMLYGDIHEVPLCILGDLNPYKNQPNKNYAGMDEEQMTRLSVAATLKKIFNGGSI